jgi:anti-anti-sigma factor
MTFGEAMLGGAALITPAGRIDVTNAEAFGDVLSGALKRAATAVAVDMAGVEHITSEGMRALMKAHRSAKTAGKGFALAGLSPHVQEIFVIGRFDRVFSLYPGVRDAIAAVSPDGLSAFDAH